MTDESSLGRLAQLFERTRATRDLDSRNTFSIHTTELAVPAAVETAQDTTETQPIEIVQEWELAERATASR